MESCRQILVVEDNVDIREGLATILETSGYQVIVASNGREGLEKLRHCLEPTLIFLDLMMPKLTGWEFLRIQKSDESLKHHRVVVVSAVDREHWSSDRVSFEPDGLLGKPIKIDDLWNMVDKFHAL